MLLNYDGILIEAVRRRNCGRFILRVRPSDGRVTLTLPQSVTQAEVTRFLQGQDAWLHEHVAALPWQPSFTAGERHLLLGRRATLGKELPCGEAALAHFYAKALEEAAKPLLAAWEKRMDVRVTRVTLKEMTSRWGSCAPATGHLSLNLRLARLPLPLIEQVVVHELCHLHHPDHSAAFYAEMTQLLPDWRERKAALDAFDIRPLPPAD